jgi:hypothetical protein
VVSRPPSGGIFYGLAGLAGLGADGELIVDLEMIWLCITVILTLLIGGRFYPEEGDDRGD